MEITTKSAQETYQLGEKLAASLKNGGIVALYGELGSGKTTFVQGVLKRLGVKQKVISPTFVFIREYRLHPNSSELKSEFTQMAYHIDLYRIESLNDAKALGLEEILADSTNIILIEWAEKIKSILPKKRIDIYFKYLDENTREIYFNPLKEYSRPPVILE